MMIAQIQQPLASWAIPATAVVLGVCGALVLAWRYRILAGTTLIASWWWTTVSLVTISMTAFVLELPSANWPTFWREPVEFAAATTVFCPVIAALGAKRPQNKAWQLIVLSLWIILVMPSFENLLLHPDQALDIRDSRAWFLVALIFISGINWLPTRFWLASLLLTAAQVALLAPYLPLGLPAWRPIGRVVGLGLAVGSISLAAVLASSKRQQKSEEHRLWLDFRDWYGLLWALRFAERVNAMASAQGLDETLVWSGFRRASDGVKSEENSLDPNPALESLVRSLLRRFVSADWIRDRAK